MLNKGKPGRDQAYPAIRAALEAILAAWAAPMALLEAPQGCRIEGRAGEVATWLRTPAAEGALAAFQCGAGGAGGAPAAPESPRGLARDAFFAQDVRVEVGVAALSFSCFPLVLPCHWPCSEGGRAPAACPWCEVSSHPVLRPGP